MPVPDSGGNKGCLAIRMAHGKYGIRRCAIPGTNSTTGYALWKREVFFRCILLAVVCLYLKMPFIIPVLRLRMWAVCRKWKQCQIEHSLCCLWVLVRTEVVGALIKDNFFINFCQQKLGSSNFLE